MRIAYVDWMLSSGSLSPPPKKNWTFLFFFFLTNLYRSFFLLSSFPFAFLVIAASFVAHYIVLPSHGILTGFLSTKGTNSISSFSQNVIFCE